MTNEETYRFPAPNQQIAELTPGQYEALTTDGGLTVGMLHRIARAAQLLAHVSATEGRTLGELVILAQGHDGVVPTNMSRRAMVALVSAGLVLQRGRGNATRYFLSESAE